MKNGRTIVLGELMPPRSGSVDPSRFPAEVFDLYSIPAFDAGRPDIVQGSRIGSTKQIVEPGDVLLSKIVPHIRRSWVVGQTRGRRLIASGEWIVFRGPQVHPDYLRHVLSGDPFHARFMQTVSGVGGSLLRARPSQVANIEVRLPPLAEQRRIAAILDQADALRAKRRAALAQLDTLKESVFVHLFGKPGTRTRGWPLVSLMDVCSPRQWPTISTDQLLDSGFPVYGANGQIGYYSDYNHEHPTVLVTCRGATCGTINVSPAKCYVTGNAMALDDPDPDRITIQYLEASMRLRGMRDTISGSAQPQITRQGLSSVQLVLPPLELQRRFGSWTEAADQQKRTLNGCVAHLDALFASLQHRAFSGDL